ncbi:hypothetical protein [Mycolicibacterium flavescens]|nr:hypothetical protein [Mycolicibacterium flavescens]
MRNHGTRTLPKVTAVVALCASLMTGCDSMTAQNGPGDDALTPEQSKAQVVDSAREVVQTLQLPVTRVLFRHESCNDQQEPPFRGNVSIWLPLAPSFEDSDREMAQWVQQLKAQGWSGDTEFKSHGTTVEKNNVVASFAPQNASTPNRMVTFYGECRDFTTTRATAGDPQDISLDE